MRPTLKQPHSCVAVLDGENHGLDAERHPRGPERSSRPSLVIRPHRGLLDFDLASLWRYRELLHLLVLRELKVRYKQAALGAAWAVIQPLFAAIIFTVVFGFFARI